MQLIVAMLCRFSRSSPEAIVSRRVHVREAPDDANPPAHEAGFPPPWRTRRTFARPFQFLGARCRTGPHVLCDLWTRPEGARRTTQPLHAGASASLGLRR